MSVLESDIRTAPKWSAVFASRFAAFCASRRSALVFALDFVHVLVVLLAQTASFIVCMVTWWRRRNVEGQDGRDALVSALTSSNHSAADRLLDSLRRLQTARELATFQALQPHG